MEAGCGWLPSWLHRIDEHLELAGAAEAPELTMNATEYFARNCWISTECDDKFVSDDSKRKVLWDNAVDLYRFPAGYLPA